MEEASRLMVEGSIDRLDDIVSWITEFCSSHEPASPHENSIQLISEELFINSIKHGYGKGRSDGPIWLTLLPQPEGAVLVYEDEAPRFDPFVDSPEADTESGVEDRAVGGLGIHLMKVLSQTASYRRHDDRNVITLVFGPGPLPPYRKGSWPAETKTLKTADTAARASTAYAASVSDGPVGESSKIRPRGLTLRILLILLFLPIAGIAVAGVLNYLKFERILTQTAASRYDPVMRELVRAINGSLRGGLTLASTRTTGDLIERSVLQFEGAFDLVVRDTEGTNLFVVSGTGEEMAELGEIHLPSPGEIHHDLSRPEAFVGHMTIHQEGVPVGVLSLVHDGSAATAAIPDLGAKLERAAIVTVVPVLVLITLVASLLLGRIEGVLHVRRTEVNEAALPNSPRPTSFDPLVHAVWKIGRILSYAERAPK